MKRAIEAKVQCHDAINTAAHSQIELCYKHFKSICMYICTYALAYIYR